MKIARLFSAFAFSLLLGVTTMVYAQEQHEDSKPQEDTKPQQDQAKPAKPDKTKPAQDQDKDKEKPANPAQDKATPNSDRMGRQDNAPMAKQGNAPAQGQKQGRGGRIPDDKFRASFGRQHTFTVSHVTTVSGQPQFQYGGYSFVVVDAWPAGWAYTDQCYIDYIDGEYFLFDLLHPGIQVALTVVL